MKPWIEQIDDFVEKHGLECSAEELFIYFNEIVQLHDEFNQYLNDMQYRCKKALDRRKLFVEWYFKKYQNEKNVKRLIMDLSEITFVSERTLC